MPGERPSSSGAIASPQNSSKFRTIIQRLHLSAILSHVLTVVGGISLALGILIYLLNLVAGNPPPPSYLSRIRLFAAAAADTAAILRSNHRLMMQIVIKSFEPMAVDPNSTLTLNSFCYQLTNSPRCDLNVSQSGTNEHQALFANIPDLHIELQALDHYAELLQKTADASNDEDLGQATAQLTEAIGSIEQNSLIHMPIVEASLSSLTFEDRKYRILLRLVDAAEPLLSRLAAMFKAASYQEGTLATQFALKSSELDLILLHNRNASAKEKEQAYYRLVDNIQNLRSQSTLDASQTISTLEAAHAALRETLKSPMQQQQVHQEELKKLAEKLKELREELLLANQVRSP